ncbi:MAG: MobA/MobL family protein, partial [Tannerella sp.]|jgi:hypothetical protein|nr:MobA/MobL family protein [Tannerella sp.]
MIADFSIHAGKHEHSFTDEINQDTPIKPNNPHAHIMLTTREVDKDGFSAKKNRSWNATSHLETWRENWADVCNRHLERHGFDERIDHRTLAAQGIDREPTKHVGVKAQQMEKRGIATERGQLNRAIEKNIEKDKIKPTKWQVSKEIQERQVKREHFSKTADAEIWRLDRQIAQLEEHKAYLTELDEKITAFKEKQFEILNKSKLNKDGTRKIHRRNQDEFWELDKQINQHLRMKKYGEDMAKRDIEQMERMSIREQRLNAIRRPERPRIPREPTPEKIITRELDLDWDR